MINSEISMKNTKQEILDALNSALEKEKASASIKSNPAKEEKEKVVAKAIETSKVNVDQKIFSEELNNKFKDLEKAMEAEEEKLKNLYGIEKELQNIILVINAGKDCMVQTEEEKKIKTEELNASIEELEAKFKEKNLVLQQEYDAAGKKIKTERDRENEEYSYKLKREREIENNKWEDTKNQREESLARIEEDAKKLLEEANGKAEYIKELEAKVNEIPKLLQKEYDRGKTETAKELEKDYGHKIALSEKDYEGVTNRLNDKVESLTVELAKSNELSEMLQKKLDTAYAEMKELATKAVESSNGVKIIGSAASENK